MLIPAHEYTDADFWQREMDSTYRKLPILVGMTHEVPDVGDFKTLDILDVPLIISRQADGGVKVYMNVCTHRAMTLVHEPTGNKRVFTCPYHAWSFSADGSLRAVAESSKFGSDCKGRDLVQFPCYEEGGLIFAVLDPESTIDIREFLGGMMDDVALKQFENWHYIGNRVITGANWKIAYDGYLEGYHFKAAHSETIEPRTFSNIMEFDSHGPHLFIGFPQKSVLKLRDVPEDELYQYENDGYDCIRLFFPNTSIFVAPEITSVSQLIPGPTPDQNTTIVHFLNSKKPESDEERDGMVQMADWLIDVIDKEDYQVGLQVQRGLASGLQSDIIFGRNERGNQLVHKWLHYYMQGDMSAPEPTL